MPEISNTPKTTRIVYLDFVKAVAITLVCIGHAVNLVTLSGPSVLNAWIYSFHMPLFMMLSGFFASHALCQPFKPFVKRKFLQLIVPALAIPAIHVAICLIMGENGIAGIARNEIIGGLWFLKSLFIIYIIAWLFKRLPLNDGWVALLSIVFLALVPRGNFLQVNWLTIFFWTGYFLKKYYHLYAKKQTAITIAAAIFFIFLGRHSRFETINLTTLTSHPESLLWQFLTALTGSFTVIGGGYLLSSYSGFCGKLSRIGTATLGIYAMQTIILEVLAAHFIHLNLAALPFWFGDFIITPLLGIIATLVSYALVVFLKRYRWTRILFLGG